MGVWTDKRNSTFYGWLNKIEWKRHIEMIAAGVCGVLLLMAWWLQKEKLGMALALFIASYVIGGFSKAKEGALTLIRERELDVNLLMFVAAVGAAGIGYWLEGGMLIFIFSVSGALESYTLAKSEGDLSSLIKLKPEQARLWKEEGEGIMVPAGQLQQGDLILVKPGERIAADGVIRKGSSSVHEAAITGEAMPAEKTEGDEVFAGTTNGEGSLIIQVTRAGDQSMVAKMVRLIEKARSEVPATQTRIERIEKGYVKVVLFLTGMLILVPPVFFDWSWKESLYRAMIFLVVASPCALVASILPALLAAISNGARQGVLIKSGKQLTSLASLKVIAFDKTGTLTVGRPQVTDILPFGEWTEHELLRAVASIESLSEHPIARAFEECAAAEGLKLEKVESLTAHPGIGIEAEYKGSRWFIGKPRAFSTQNQEVIETARKWEDEGKTVILAAQDGEIAGCIALRDQIRPETAEMIRELKRQGILIAMLTGDQRKTAEAIAKEADLDLVFADLLPEEKVRLVEELNETYGEVAMVGDGVNDAPALARAGIGFAMGGDGTDLALETADVILMKDDLLKIPYSIRMAKKLNRIVKQNVIFALSVIFLLVTANFVQWMNLPFGVVGHEGSTILVILNGLRLLK
ncbi:MAG: heavy metal translocating P-type ATPase [Thermoactinomyces sp.]